MSTQSVRKRPSNNAKLKLTLAHPTAAKAGNVLIDNCHDYINPTAALPVSDDGMDEFPLLPITPSKSPALKKVMLSPTSRSQLAKMT